MGLRNGGVTESIGQRLRRLRTERRLSQRELASPGVSYAYISRIEAGTRQPSVKALRMLARKLGVSADYLETGSEVGQKEQLEIRLANAELELRLAQDSAAAERELRAILDEATAAGDALCASRARVGVGLAAFHAGHHADAAELLQAEVDATAPAPAARPDVYATLGRAYAASGNAQRAVRVFEQCLEGVRRDAPDDIALRVRYASYLSSALTDAGDLPRAHAVLTDALAAVDGAADPYTRVRGYWALARVASAEGHAAEALDHYRRAIALLESTDDTLHLARAHISAASVLINDDRAAEAAPHLDKAEGLFGATADRTDLAYLRTEQARRAIRLGDAEEASRRAREALDLLGSSEPPEQGAAWLVLGEALALEQDVAGATEAFERAIELLARSNRWKESARAYRAWGRLLRDAGRETEALDAFEKAAELAERSADTRAAR